MRRISWIALVIFVLVLAACNGAGEMPAAPAEEAVAEATEASAGEEMSMNPLEMFPEDVTGDIIMAGSSTVFPLAEAVAEGFVDEGYAGNITIDSIGSGGGFERFCVEGESDISNASRPIKDSEVESCGAIGREPIEFRVGTDALAVVTNLKNDWVVDVTMEELAGIFTAEMWSDVNPDWPAEPILRFIPGTDSGTFDYFVEEIFEKDPAELLAAANTQLSEDDNVLVQGVTGSQYGIAFFGYAYFSENADDLNILNIDGVEASAESVDAGSYPLARPLFIYSDAGIIAEKPQVGAFIHYFLTNVNDFIGEVGYFPADAGVIEESQSALMSAVNN